MQVGQLQLQGTGSCFALGANPAATFTLDTTQSLQVLSVQFLGGANNKFVIDSALPHLIDARLMQAVSACHCMLPQCWLASRH